jgi:steroid delta-isomerase-like uncharacterized protein
VKGFVAEALHLRQDVILRILFFEVAPRSQNRVPNAVGWAATNLSPLEGGCIIQRKRKWLVQGYTDQLMSEGRLEVADQILADDVQFFGPGSGEPVRGREPFKEFVILLRTAFPDLRCEVHAVVEEQDRVACWLTVHGTHRGSWRGLQPTGRQLALQAMNLFRFSGDRIVEVRAFFNVADYDTQLGKGSDPPFRTSSASAG